ncbi:MAG: tRNA (adenosine(37)-N6)-threonylcarbamoyltransferase complex ATPase subunit type 1 TsaE [Bacteroidota bacterium]
MEYKVESLAELPRVAGELIALCDKPRVIAFFGEMGAGKTTFIRAICQKLGVSENVSSPTFSIINEYRTESGRKVFHFDLYRLEKPSEAVSLGLEEYFESGEWCLVEWPEKILNLLPSHCMEVRIDASGSMRNFSFKHA